MVSSSAAPATSVLAAASGAGAPPAGAGAARRGRGRVGRRRRRCRRRGRGGRRRGRGRGFGRGLGFLLHDDDEGRLGDARVRQRGVVGQHLPLVHEDHRLDGLALRLRHLRLDVRDLERRVELHLELGVRAGENRNRRSRSAPTENARLETGEAVATIRGTATAASWTNRPTLAGAKTGGKDLAPTRRVAAWARDRGRGSRATASGTHSVLNATFMVTVRVCRVWGDVSLRRRASSSVVGAVAFRQRKRQRRPDGQILIFGDRGVGDVQKC